MKLLNCAVKWILPDDRSIEPRSHFLKGCKISNVYKMKGDSTSSGQKTFLANISWDSHKSQSNLEAMIQFLHVRTSILHYSEEDEIWAHYAATFYLLVCFKSCLVKKIIKFVKQRQQPQTYIAWHFVTLQMLLHPSYSIIFHLRQLI